MKSGARLAAAVTVLTEISARAMRGLEGVMGFGP